MGWAEADFFRMSNNNHKGSPGYCATHRESFVNKSVTYWRFTREKAEALFEALKPEAFNENRPEKKGGPGNWVCWGTNKSIRLANNGPAADQGTEPFEYFLTLMKTLYPDRTFQIIYIDYDKLA